MLKQAIYHRPKQNWAYAYDRATLHLRIRTGRGDVSAVNANWGDKYAWKETSKIEPMKLFASDDLFDYWEIAVVPPYRRMRYAFEFISGKETLYLTEKEFTEQLPDEPWTFFDFPYINPVDVFQPPAWVKDAVFYQIFPERFANGDPSNDPENVEPWGGTPTPKNFFGGDLQGVIDHLDHLEELGVNAIYFNPIFEATTNHKYDTRDYLKVDPQFGTNELLKELVDKCHARGIRVLLDAVFNHSGKTFPPFVDVLEKGAESKYAGWFHVREFPLRFEDGVQTYDTFAFEPIMPKLNTENQEVREYLFEVARYWIEEIGIDGWRLDVANEVDHRFWRDFRDVVKKVNPDAYILGEIFHDSIPWLNGDQFDAVMNYPFTEAVLDFAARGTRDSKQFADLIGSLLASYPQQVNEVAYNLLGSHDTPRLLTLCEEDKRRMKLASVIQFTFAGTPSIYYGDEVGLTGINDPGCRKCMEWDEEKQDRDLFGFFSELVRIRRNNRALRDGSYELLSAESGKLTLAYAREADGERFVIAVNAGKRKASLKAPLSGELIGNASIVFGEAEVSINGNKLNVALPPFGYAIIRLNK
ncbi:alpha-glycosidase [Cohnella faecalis]|uniref:Alpha-glycosidase n=1 Tax=Cohnella faecalis TaxID=2315694 RepID=A0A398CJP9_9BACL|nr:alpha-glycosidase [Cohnella faecalis]RIE02362.1 alpha-glycosidase [Cohnella faecalis]